MRKVALAILLLAPWGAAAPGGAGTAEGGGAPLSAEDLDRRRKALDQVLGAGALPLQTLDERIARWTARAGAP